MIQGEEREKVGHLAGKDEEEEEEEIKVKMKGFMRYLSLSQY